MHLTAKNNLQDSLTILHSVIWDLHKHCVSIEVLEIVISEKEMFFAILDLFETCDLPRKPSSFRNLVLCREKDLKALKAVIRTVEILQIFFKEIREGKLF